MNPEFEKFRNFIEELHRHRKIIDSTEGEELIQTCIEHSKRKHHSYTYIS